MPTKSEIDQNYTRKFLYWFIPTVVLLIVVATWAITARYYETQECQRRGGNHNDYGWCSKCEPLYEINK